MKRHVLAILCAVNGALLVVLGAMWFGLDGSIKHAKWQVPSPVHADYGAMLAVLPHRRPVNASQLVRMLEHPLFAYASPAATKDSDQAGKSSDFLETAVLQGVFSGGQSGGIILSVAGKSRRLHMHETVDGWTLSAINGREVNFSSNGKTRTLVLSRARLDSPAASGLPIQSAPIPPPVSQPPVPQAQVAPPPGRGTNSVATPPPPNHKKSRFGP